MADWLDQCPVLGIPLDYTASGKGVHNSASLDRSDSTKGYVLGNVKVISLRANLLKRDASLEELIRLGEYAGRLSSARE